MEAKPTIEDGIYNSILDIDRIFLRAIQKGTDYLKN